MRELRACSATLLCPDHEQREGYRCPPDPSWEGAGGKSGGVARVFSARTNCALFQEHSETSVGCMSRVGGCDEAKRREWICWLQMVSNDD